MVDAGHLQSGPRLALANRQVSEGAAGPLLQVWDAAGRFVRQLNTGGIAQPKLLEVLGVLLLAQLIGDHQGTDVGGLTKDAGGGIRLGAVFPGIVDRHARHIDGTGDLVHLIRGGHTLLQCSSRGNHLGYGTRLIRMGDAAVFKVLTLIKLILNILIGIHGIGIGHGKHLAGGSIENYCFRTRSLGVGLGLFQLLLNVGLQVQIQSEGDVATINGIHDVTQSAWNHLAIRGYVLGGLAVNASKFRIARGLETELSMAIHRHLAHNVFTNGAVGVLADVLAVRCHSVVLIGDLYGNIRIDIAHQYLILGIGFELIEDVVLIHLGGRGAGILNQLRDSLRHVLEGLLHFLGEEAIQLLVIHAFGRAIILGLDLGLVF